MAIAQTKAVIRMFPNSQLPKNVDATFERIFGDRNWQVKLYSQSNQRSLFEEFEDEQFRVPHEEVLTYARSRFNEIFRYCKI